MFIVFDIDTPQEQANRIWFTKQKAKDYIKYYAKLCKRTTAGFRIYDTERHVTIKLVPKKKVVWEASFFDTDTQIYKRELFGTVEGGKNWCETHGASSAWTRNDYSGNLRQRNGLVSYAVKVKEVR